MAVPASQPPSRTEGGGGEVGWGGNKPHDPSLLLPPVSTRPPNDLTQLEAIGHGGYGCRPHRSASWCEAGRGGQTAHLGGRGRVPSTRRETGILPHAAHRRKDSALRAPHTYRGSAQLSSAAGPAGSPPSRPTPGPVSGRTGGCCDTAPGRLSGGGRAGNETAS